ncbi:glycosyltransferase family 32 protein [Sporolactobacillus terrae]|uniref:Glycosyl transferase n=1 Tax=Sporolactobacillus terrae TaxID=269673 RepID=A0ABX5Q4L9_9BACL|nr:glycosyltransferase [Sporolactobacillus terrae]QAA21579.1 glycosyl transferase [Sporolactobacillus terrae]QAA24551.1 glycosyl transferase [Sporolactobacillus terrae]
MMPKIIHCAWFGKSRMPEDVQKCIASWHKYCPDYEIKLWNEDNYDVTKCKYMHDAYTHKKWSFVSDFFRLDIIYQYGGIYLDTDVELIRNLDNLLKLPLFMGLETIKKRHSVNVGLALGAQPNHPVVKAMRDDYYQMDFVLPNGQLNLTACPDIQTELLLKYGVKRVNEKQEFKDFTVFPTEYFCPLNYDTGMLNITENTYSIHHYDAAWKSNVQKDIITLRWELNKKYKSQLFIRVISVFIVYKRHYGIRAFIEIIKEILSKLNLRR